MKKKKTLSGVPVDHLYKRSASGKHKRRKANGLINKKAKHPDAYAKSKKRTSLKKYRKIDSRGSSD